MWSEYPQLSMQEISTMSREEFWARIDATELRLSKDRYENAKKVLDERVALNSTQSGSDGISTFNIMLPEQLIDFPYIEGLLVGDEEARPTNTELLLKQTYAESPEHKLEESRESNLSKFRQIAMEMYSEDEEEEHEH